MSHVPSDELPLSAVLAMICTESHPTPRIVLPPAPPPQRITEFLDRLCQTARFSGCRSARGRTKFFCKPTIIIPTIRIFRIRIWIRTTENDYVSSGRCGRLFKVTVRGSHEDNVEMGVEEVPKLTGLGRVILCLALEAAPEEVGRLVLSAVYSVAKGHTK